MRALLLAMLLMASAVAAAADEPKLAPYNLHFSVAWGGTTLGDASIVLSALADKDCYRVVSQTRPIALVRWLYGTPMEMTQFCMREGVVRPSHFEYLINGREKDNFALDFDWAAHHVRTQKGGNVTDRELPDVAYDRLVLQTVVRQWARTQAGEAHPAEMEFNMVDDDRITPYRFAILGHESVETPAGTFDTLRVDRVDNPNRSLHSWLAPTLDFTPVKIEHIEHGEVKLRMLRLP